MLICTFSLGKCLLSPDVLLSGMPPMICSKLTIPGTAAKVEHSSVPKYQRKTTKLSIQLKVVKM